MTTRPTPGATVTGARGNPGNPGIPGVTGNVAAATPLADAAGLPVGAVPSATEVDSAASVARGGQSAHGRPRAQGAQAGRGAQDGQRPDAPRVPHEQRPMWLERLRAVQAPWVWSFVGAVLVLLATMVFFGISIAGNVLQTALVYGVFMVLVGLGQMLVITSGAGNIDLSVPSTIALAGVVGMHVMRGADDRIVMGLLAVAAVGGVVGLVNYALIRMLRIPPIIATLSSSFIIQSVAITQGRNLPSPPAALGNFATARLGPIPYLALAAAALSVLLAVLLHRSRYGRRLSAVGQNARAAWLAGVNVHRTRCAAYVLCAVIAAFAAVALAAVSGGAALDMGVEYMLISIAVVVIGGTLVTGGRPSVLGVWGASMFLFLTTAMLNAVGADIGVRSLVYGVLIIAVIAVAGGESRN